MIYEWDENKNQRNYRKHGVWFDEAQTIWADGRSTEFFDPESSDDEDRFIRIGHSKQLNILLSCFLRSLGQSSHSNHFSPQGYRQGKRAI
jgi:uncharacterized DUF497 family protein